jgi:hypothetical protein
LQPDASALIMRRVCVRARRHRRGDLARNTRHREATKMPAFALRKWYMDVANAAGDAWIGYYAGLRWHALHLDFTHQLRRSPAEGVRERGEVGAQAEPQWSDADTLHWRPAGLEATWRRCCSPAITETLFASDEGQVAWSCLLPRANASLRTDRGVLSGTGYVECLELSIAPWRLPLAALHWGRCHAAAHDLVWIRWDGRAPRSLAWLDGVRCASATITETTVSADGARWQCGERVTLRRGALGHTLLAPLRALLTAVPASALALDEHKWYTRGRLTVDGIGADAVGIAERVGW